MPERLQRKAPFLPFASNRQHRLYSATDRQIPEIGLSNRDFQTAIRPLPQEITLGQWG